MTDRRRKWIAIPGLFALAAAAILLSAAQGAAPTQQAPAPAPAAAPATPAAPVAPAATTAEEIAAGETEAGEGWAYSGASTPMGRAPEQPINFPHPVHVKTLGLNCLYCHFSANQSTDAGMPAVGTCMGCHLIVGPQRPAREGVPARRSEDIATLQDYWNKKLPVPWVRIHKVPDYVQFPHMRHVNAGVTCQSCHGDVQNMERVYQFASLNMGWCVKCHVEGYVPPAVPPPGLENYPGANIPEHIDLRDSVVRTATGPGAPVGMVGYPRRARYDCSVCHY